MKQGKAWLANCITRESVEIDRSPFLIGSDSASDWQLEAVTQNLQCSIRLGIRGVTIEAASPHFPDAKVVIDGQLVTSKVLKIGSDHTFQIGHHLFVICVPKKSLLLNGAFAQWQDSIVPHWIVNRLGPDKKKGTFSLGQILILRDEGKLQRNRDAVFPAGSRAGFALWQFDAYAPEIKEEAEDIPTAEPVESPAPMAASGSTSPALPEGTPVRVIDAEHGEFTCPVCWLRFDRGDVMHVAVHDELYGDPVLGEDHMLRFHATQFNDKGQAIDPKGIPALDLACPHCRRILPHGFFDVPHFIFSICGAPGSGKSYYLATLLKTLQSRLYKDFGVAFRDADPAGNALLNSMRNNLFSATSPQGAVLAKTRLEGEMYEQLPRFGRTVALPKPFVFALSKNSGENSACSVVFYDNAGEHFEPGRDSANSPGAQHLASSAGIFFLFDPTTNIDFRRRLQGSEDPQLAQEAVDQQDIILAEAEVRIKRLLGLTRGEQIDKPIALILGKADVWLHLLGDDEQIEESFKDNALDHGAIDRNSQRVRNLLVNIAPSVVATAESFAREVKYFPVSALGHTPIQFVDASGVERVGPDPAKMNPQWVEIASLWVLSQVRPELVPSFR